MRRVDLQTLSGPALASSGIHLHSLNLWPTLVPVPHSVAQGSPQPGKMASVPSTTPRHPGAVTAAERQGARLAFRFAEGTVQWLHP